MFIADLMCAIGQRMEQSQDALGLRGVSYPLINTVPASPWGMVRQSLAIPSRTVKERFGVQVVHANIDIVLLITSDMSSPGDSGRLDGLSDRVLDLFDANAYGGNVNHAFSDLLDDPVDWVWNDAQTRRVALEWGEAGYCHAAILTLDSQFKRRAVLPEEA